MDIHAMRPCATAPAGSATIIIQHHPATGDRGPARQKAARLTTDDDTTNEKPPRPTLPTGAHVEVRNRLDGRWTAGFEVISCEAAGYRLRRLSDSSELPAVFDFDDVRLKRAKSNNNWWF